MSEHDTRREELVPLGYIAGVHGLKGWIKVHSWTQPREAILEYQPWLLGEGLEPVRILEGQVHGKGLIARLPGVDDREQALALVRQEISVRREQLPALDSDSYYWADLEGLEVATEGGQPLGRIARMMETGANDVMIVAGDRERLIPFVPGEYVKQVDLHAGRVIVDWDPDF